MAGLTAEKRKMLANLKRRLEQYVAEKDRLFSMFHRAEGAIEEISKMIEQLSLDQRGEDNGKADN
jgi:predicted nuclease with TOPRIM domain